MVVNGNTTWTDGTFQLNGDGRFVNPATRTFDIAGNLLMQWGSGNSPHFDNAGTLTKSAGTGTATLNFGVNNTGAVQIASGTLHIGDNGVTDNSTGSFSVPTGTTLTLEWAFGRTT